MSAPAPNRAPEAASPHAGRALFVTPTRRGGGFRARRERLRVVAHARASSAAGRDQLHHRGVESAETTSDALLAALEERLAARSSDDSLRVQVVASP